MLRLLTQISQPRVNLIAVWTFSWHLWLNLPPTVIHKKHVKVIAAERIAFHAWLVFGLAVFPYFDNACLKISPAAPDDHMIDREAMQPSEKSKGGKGSFRLDA